MIGTLWSRAGGVVAHPDNAYRLLREQRQLALLLVELPWSGELLNRTPAWGGNWLRRAREGRWISELHSSYLVGSMGHPTGLDAG